MKRIFRAEMLSLRLVVYSVKYLGILAISTLIATTGHALNNGPYLTYSSTGTLHYSCDIYGISNGSSVSKSVTLRHCGGGIYVTETSWGDANCDWPFTNDQSVDIENGTFEVSIGLAARIKLETNGQAKACFFALRSASSRREEPYEELSTEIWLGKNFLPQDNGAFQINTTKCPLLFLPGSLEMDEENPGQFFVHDGLEIAPASDAEADGSGFGQSLDCRMIVAIPAPKLVNGPVQTAPTGNNNDVR